MNKIKKELKIILTLYVIFFSSTLLLRIFIQIGVTCYLYFFTERGFVFDLPTTLQSVEFSVFVGLMTAVGLYINKRMGIFFFCIFMIAVFWYLTR